MDPSSPTKFPMSPGMPLFPVSPERVAGTKPPYGMPASHSHSPSMPDLRTSPLRSMTHRRNDSDVSVHGLAAMFENLEVKDFKEAQAKYLQALQKQKTKHASEIKELERKHAIWMSRRDVRVEELKSELERYKEAARDAIPRETWDEQRQDHREAIAKWESAMRSSEEKRKQAEKKAHEHSRDNEIFKTKLQQYKKKNMELSKEAMRATSYIPTFQAKIQSLEKTVRITESDLKFQTGEAEKYKNQVYGLQVDLESIEARLSEEVQTLQDRLRLIEGERDALKTSLKEEEVLRIATEGQIPLPAATTEEHDEFGSPVRSPRKQRTPERDEEDKENVAPKKTAVELRFLQKELALEKRLRERAQEQIEFMKMECQFECCSCRIADLRGAKYIHDGGYAAEMDRIKASVPALTPPPSSHGEDPMDDVIIKEEPVDERPLTPPAEESQPPEQLSEGLDQSFETTGFPRPPVSASPDPIVAFSPTTGTFRAVPSPVKAPASTHTATPAKPSQLGLSAITELTTESSPWTPDAESTVIQAEAVSILPFRVEPHAEPEPQPQPQPEVNPNNIIIHEDAVADSDEENEENSEPQTPWHDPSGPATPAQYLMRTITTTTTIPLHFSPFTPASKKEGHPMTPSTVAHAPASAQTPVLGELSLNKLPIDREQALAMIRERRGRARSMAAGQGTPMSKMMEGITRRDISAPVSRV